MSASPRLPIAFVSSILIVLASGCLPDSKSDGSASVSDGGDEGGEFVFEGGGHADSGKFGCLDSSDCEDGIACTIGQCIDGSCRHSLGANSATCPMGQYCDLTSGCTPGIACAHDAQCQDKLGGDPCKTNIHCHQPTATCQFSWLDKDGDGHPPVACGGADCDDSHPAIHPGAPELCDGKDNDCDGAIDDGDVCGGSAWCNPEPCPEPPLPGFLKCCTPERACGYQESPSSYCYPVDEPGGGGGSGGSGGEDTCGLSQCPEPQYQDFYKCCTSQGECGFKNGPGGFCYDANNGGGGSGGFGGGAP